MDKDNNNKSKRTKKTTNKNTKKAKKKNRRIGVTIFKFILVTILMVAFISAGAITGLIIAVAKDAPEVDTSQIISSLNESSKIVDENGNLVERIHTDEYRTVVSLDKIPEYVQNAFIAIEDERFETHKGIDIKRIGGALWADIKAGAPVQGASTITQQLVKNMYLLDEVDRDNLINDVSRKIKEAYLAIQIERELTKDQLLEAYLNKISLGQGAYGVQAAANTYFSKDVSDLTIAEAAMIAGITKNPSRYPLYRTISPESIDEDDENIIGDIMIEGQRYIMVYNDSESVVNRKNTILYKMKELGFINDQQYQEAKEVDIRSVLNPTKTEQKDITSYFGDYVRKQVIKTLQEELGYSLGKANELLYSGGIEIYSTIDVDLQSRIEKVYNDFDNIVDKIDGNNKPKQVDSSSFRNGNIVNKSGKVIFYKKSRLLTENGHLIIDKDTYNFKDNGDLILDSNKLNVYSGTVDIDDYYTISENNNLLTYKMGSLSLTQNDYVRDEKDRNRITINAKYLNDNKSFYTVDDKNNLLINPKYFLNYGKGILQPQSAVVITDYRTGKIKALIGGRNVEGRGVLNRATNSQRQPGSAIKPLGVYLPALDNGYTAASIIDDVLHYYEGNRWPKNWYENSRSYSHAYRGLTTLRESVEQSVNVNAVKVLDNIGIDTSLSYLNKMGLSGSIVTRDENSAHNDEKLAALALGGMTDGVSPLEMTGAYSSIANDGVYIEPIAFTKIVDRHGNILYENNPDKIRVVDPKVAYLMTDILESTVSDGLAKRAVFDKRLFDSTWNNKIPAAGKTGTTQNKGDAWFVGYTPYYAASVWVGNDINAIKLTQGSSMAAEFWSYIMSEAHRGFEPKGFIMPDGFVTVTICTESGKIAKPDLCENDLRGSTVRKEIFIKGTEPREYCDLHVTVDIDTTTSKLANEYCPPELVERRVYIKRELPYNPWTPEMNALEQSTSKIVRLPKDYTYNAPVEVCDEHTEPVMPDFDDIIDSIFGNDNNGTETDGNNDINNGNGIDTPNTNNTNENEDSTTNQNDDGVTIIDSTDDTNNTETTDDNSGN